MVQRQLVHTRTVDIQVYRRDDELWDVEATLADVKTKDSPLPTGDRKAGDPMHDKLLCLTIDLNFNIVDAQATSRRNPYPGYCEQATDGYRRLIGLNLLKGFRKAVKERLGGVQGCTHLSELTQFMPTAAVQAFAGEPEIYEKMRTLMTDTQAPQDPDYHFQLDRCHAMRTDGPLVQLYFPKWFNPARTPSP